jgi:hypothetical protein
MTKILAFSVFLIALAFSCQAQQKFPNTSTAGVTGKDSLTNTDTVLSTFQGANNLALGTIQLNIVKKTGTIAGKAYILGSVDGIYYTKVDSVTFVDGAVFTAFFKYTTLPYVFYEVQSISTGTQVSYVRAYGLFRRSYYNPL